MGETILVSGYGQNKLNVAILMKLGYKCVKGAVFYCRHGL